MATTIRDVDEYIAGQPAAVQDVLREVRRRIRAAAPETGEAIKYGMPMATLGTSYLLYYGAWKQHLGLYPVARQAAALEAEIASYRTAKDALQFRYRDPIPYDLIERLVAELLAQRRATLGLADGSPDHG